MIQKLPRLQELGKVVGVGSKGGAVLSVAALRRLVNETKDLRMMVPLSRRSFLYRSAVVFAGA